ncbi:MAG: redoxin family protein [Chitinophagaceae bacterium]|nr:redoxin family protein [Oligoflexus sp.]
MFKKIAFIMALTAHTQAFAAQPQGPTSKNEPALHSDKQQVQPWLGVEVDVSISGGVGVKRVISGTPADRAGFLPGDLITAIDKEKIKSRDELMAVLRDKGVGSKVAVHLTRKGKSETKELKLEMVPNLLDLAKAQLLNKPAPAFELTELGSGGKRTIKNADMKGKVFILEFWATWCPACRAASPFINEWSKAHKDIPVIGISDEEDALVSAFVAHEKISYTQTLDHEGKVQGAFGMGSIPAFILIDRSGQVNDLTVGVGEYLETLLNKADALAKQKT